jgi:hypothetical protein
MATHCAGKFESDLIRIKLSNKYENMAASIMRIPTRCLQPLRTGNVTVYAGDTVAKLKQQIQTAFDISVSNQILLINKVRLDNDRTYESYLKNAHVAEPVHILDSRMCETCKILVVDLINAFKIFDNMDFDQGGELSRQEIFVGLMNLGGEIGQYTEKEVMGMIDQADKDRNDSIDFFEFWYVSFFYSACMLL